MPCSPAGFVYVLGAAARVLVGDEGDANRPAFKLHVERLHLDRKLHSVPDLRLQGCVGQMHRRAPDSAAIYSDKQIRHKALLFIWPIQGFNIIQASPLTKLSAMFAPPACSHRHCCALHHPCMRCICLERGRPSSPRQVTVGVHAVLRRHAVVSAPAALRWSGWSCGRLRG